MSRSRKKSPVIKDGGWYGKRLHNRRFRRRNKQRIQSGREPLHKYEITNPWDICDWKLTYFEGYSAWSGYRWNNLSKKEYEAYVDKIKRK